jgi:hypothetical protein
MLGSTTCAKPDCQTIVIDKNGKNVTFTLPDGKTCRGLACPEHAEWLAEAIADCEAGAQTADGPCGGSFAVGSA